MKLVQRNKNLSVGFDNKGRSELGMLEEKLGSFWMGVTRQPGVSYSPENFAATAIFLGDRSRLYT